MAIAASTSDPAHMARARRNTICLCMIVKNEARVIERCLASVRDLIDHWVITDTGSDDGTQDLIRAALAGIPGELHEEPFIDFGQSRTRNIRLAHGAADYLLLVDADMVVRRDAPLEALGADAYLLRHSGPCEYRINRLVRGDIAWRYEGATHEYLVCDQPHRVENLDALVIDHFADGGSRSDKFERDERLLRAAVRADPGDSRSVFYLAQTLRDLRKSEESITWYRRRAEMGGWEEEIYYSLLQAGIQRADDGDWPRAMDCLLRAWEARPTRLEACYQLVSRLRAAGRHMVAHQFVRDVFDQPQPADVLFVEPWVYHWGLLFEYSITSYYAGDPANSVEACDRLLAMPDLPEAVRRQTETNRRFGAQLLPDARPPHARSPRISAADAAVG